MPSLRRCSVRGLLSIVAPARSARPTAASVPTPGGCDFCEGSEASTEPEVFALRPSGGGPNTGGWIVRIVPNKFPALVPATGKERAERARHEWPVASGTHEVIIESPEHRTTLDAFSTSELTTLFTCYRSRLVALQQRREIKSIALFRNEGPAAGASQRHSHSQLLGLPIVSDNLAREVTQVCAYRRRFGRCSICAELDSARGTALVVSVGSHIVAVAAATPRAPFELWLIPKRHVHDFAMSSDAEIVSLAKVLKGVLKKLRRSLGDFSFNLVFQSAPVRATRPVQLAFHWRVEIIPRLTVLSGGELATGIFIVSTSPEATVQALRSTAHPRGSDPGARA